MVGRVRRTRAGRLTLQVDDGVPSIVPERHWRWHGGGVEGYMQQSVSEVVSMAWSRARREADPGEVDWGEVRSALSEVAEGGRKTTAAAERAARLLERVEGRWGVVREAEEAMARLDVVRQALGVPAEAPVVSRPVPRPKPEASETAGARRAAGSSHERVLAAARRIADTDGVFRQPELRRTLAEEPLGAIPRTTMITVLTRLADDGAVERVTDEPGTWRLVSSQ